MKDIFLTGQFLCNYNMMLYLNKRRYIDDTKRKWGFENQYGRHFYKI